MLNNFQRNSIMTVLEFIKFIPGKAAQLELYIAGCPAPI
jgi:hypothetical protein